MTEKPLTNNTCVLISDVLCQLCLRLDLHRSGASLFLKEADDPIYGEQEESRIRERDREKEAQNTEMTTC